MVVIKTELKKKTAAAPAKAAAAAAASSGECKWCEKGECWKHGQIAQPKGTTGKERAKGKNGKGTGGKGKGWDKCAAMKHYARTCWREPVFWIDVVSLKQSWDAEVYQNKMGNAFVGDIQFPGDFTFPRIKRCIQNIGNTVMVTQHHGSIPSAMDRIFCIFEVYATTCKNESSSRLAKFHIASSFMYPKLCVVKDHQIRVDVEAAKSTNPDARMTILNNLRDDPGFKEANTICAATIAKSDVENTHQWWFSVLVTSIGIGVIIGLPALGSSLPHYYYWCILACSLQDISTLHASRRFPRIVSVAHGILFGITIFLNVDWWIMTLSVVRLLAMFLACQAGFRFALATARPAYVSKCIAACELVVPFASLFLVNLVDSFRVP